MRIFCSICKDLFIPYSDVQVTNCGHLYHSSCISTWIKQHRTCPQCRSKLSQPIKIYFDVEKDGELDVGELEHQVETLSDKLREKEKSVRSLEEEKENYVKIIQDIEESNEKLKNKSKTLKISVKALKEQVTNLARQNETLPYLRNEVAEWKNKVTTLEKIETLIKDSADEVNKMLEGTPVTELAVRYLCTYVGVLKTQLEKSEAKYTKLDKAMKALNKSLMEEKKKNSSDSDLVKSLKMNINKLELQLFHTKSLFRDYKRKHPEKGEVTTSQKISSQSLGGRHSLDIDLDLDEDHDTQSSKLYKSSRDVFKQLYKTEDFVDKLNLIMDSEEKESKTSKEINKAINHWEELVSAGTSAGLGLTRSKSIIKSSYSSRYEEEVSRTTSYAFDGLGGRKKLRLGEPTPQEEFLNIKKKKTQKFVSSCQSKKILDFCQVLD